MRKKVKKLEKKMVLEKPKRVAAYARVSSGKDAMLHSLSAQVSHYSELIQAQVGSTQVCMLMRHSQAQMKTGRISKDSCPTAVPD